MPPAPRPLLMFKLQPWHWGPGYLDRANIRLRFHTTPTTPLPPLSLPDPPDSYHYPADRLDFLIKAISTEKDPTLRVVAVMDLTYLLLNLRVTTNPPFAMYEGCRDPQRPHRIFHGMRAATWEAASSLYDTKESTLAFGALVYPHSRRRDWSEETGYLVSLAQMRRGGDVYVVSVRGIKAWILRADIDESWLQTLHCVPDHCRKMWKEIVVEVYGGKDGWNLTQEEGRARYWEGLGKMLEQRKCRIAVENIIRFAN